MCHSVHYAEGPKGKSNYVQLGGAPSKALVQMK